MCAYVLGVRVETMDSVNSSFAKSANLAGMKRRKMFITKEYESVSNRYAKKCRHKNKAAVSYK